MASEDAETMDEVFHGTEEQLERTNTMVILTMHRTRAKRCPLCSPREEVVARWKRSDGVQVSFGIFHYFPVVFADISFQKQRW